MNKRRNLFKYISGITIILLILLTYSVPIVKAEPVTPYSYVVIDRLSGDILLQKNAHELIYPASTTKILTAIVALENSGLSSTMTASDVATGELESGAVRLGLIEGEQMQFYDLLHALLLKSANDVALVIAENIGGSVSSFEEMCNDFAFEKGAINTHFVNPHGLHDDDHYTTAYDLAILADYAMNNYTFSSITSKTDYMLNETTLHPSFPRLVNSNPILGKNNGYDFIVTGIKTGYTSKAKYVLVSSARNYDGREVICVVTGCETRLLSGQFSLDLIKEAFNNYQVQSIISSGEIVANYLIDQVSIPLAASKQLEYLLPKDSNSWQINKEITLNDLITPPIYQGDILGEITYSQNDVIIGQSLLVATREYVIDAMINNSLVVLTKNQVENLSNHYVWFIISIIWVIIVLSILLILNRFKRRKNRSENHD